MADTLENSFFNRTVLNECFENAGPATAKIDTGIRSFEISIPELPPKSLMNNFLECAARVDENDVETRCHVNNKSGSVLVSDSPPVLVVKEEIDGNDTVQRSECPREATKRKSEINDGGIARTNGGGGQEGLPQKLSKPGRSTDSKMCRERIQRVSRDAFRKKVLLMANTWMGHMDNGNLLKCNIVVNEDSCKPKIRKNKCQRNKCTTVKNDHGASAENTSDVLINKQNGFYYYYILCTKQVENLVARGRPAMEGESEMTVLVDRLAMIADIYLRIMFNNEIRSAVFIKFDDGNIPALFARQTTQLIDTCITGPPGHYWTKVLHLDNTTKTSQHITLQRVRSGRLIQDSTFVVVGENGMLEQIYSIIPERFVSPSRSRRCFKEMFNYVMSIPESDLSCLGWDMINEAGVLDPIKTFLPKVVAANERSADDGAFTNYIDMFVMMVLHRHKMERTSPEDYQSPSRIKVFRTEYKYELAGRVDHPGVYYYRNHEDWITDMCMVNMIDNLFDGNEISSRMFSEDGIYFYDVQPVYDVLMKLKAREITDIRPEHSGFHRYVLSECDEVQEMVAYSFQTIRYRLNDVLEGDHYLYLHKTDPARTDPTRCHKNLENLIIKCNLSEYKSTYYIERSISLTRVFNGTPVQLSSRDCVLRSYRLKWKGIQTNGKHVFVMYPVFSVVFKNLSLFEEIVQEEIETLPDEDFSFSDVHDDHLPRMPNYDYNVESGVVTARQQSVDQTQMFGTVDFSVPEFDYNVRRTTGRSPGALSGSSSISISRLLRIRESLDGGFDGGEVDLDFKRTPDRGRDCESGRSELSSHTPPLIPRPAQTQPT